MLRLTEKDLSLVDRIRTLANEDIFITSLVYEVVDAMEVADNIETLQSALMEFIAPKTMELAITLFLAIDAMSYQMRNGIPATVKYRSTSELMKQLSATKIPKCMELPLLKAWALTFDGDVAPLRLLDFLLVDELEEVSWLVPYRGTSDVKCLKDAPTHVLEYVPNGRVAAVDRNTLYRVPAVWRLRVLSERTNQVVEFVWVRTPNSRLTTPQLVKAGSTAKPSELIKWFPFTRVNEHTASLLSNGHTIGSAACFLLGAVHLGIGDGRRLISEMHKHMSSDRELRIEAVDLVEPNNFFPHLFEQQVEAQTKPLARTVEHWRLGLR